MRMVGRLFVMSALMVLSSFAMVARGVRMVFCRLLVVRGCFLRHGVFTVLGRALGKALSRQKPSERVADALARRFGTGAIEGRIRAFVITASR
jgi:hypothetical protein